MVSLMVSIPIHRCSFYRWFSRSIISIPLNWKTNIVNVGSEVLTAIVKKSNTVFWDMLIELCLPPAFTVVSCSGYYSVPKMEAMCSSETSVGFQRTTLRYIPEDSTHVL
jgi:hypothetical protein